jgi:hypothetical protein
MMTILFISAGLGLLVFAAAAVVAIAIAERPGGG